MKKPYSAGPWHVADADGSIGTVESFDGKVVAQAQQVVPVRDDLRQEERRSNAQLIAAAPEMLAALALCILAYEEHRDGQPTGHLWADPNHIYFARLAFAKATGGGE
jgi:hypothetical protein